MAINIFFACDSNVKNVQHEIADDASRMHIKLTAAKCFLCYLHGNPLNSSVTIGSSYMNHADKEELLSKTVSNSMYSSCVLKLCAKADQKLHALIPVA